MNTYTSNGQGIRWVSYVLLGNNLFIVDALGQNNERPNDVMFKILDENKIRPLFYHGKFSNGQLITLWLHSIEVSKIINELIKDYGDKLTPAIISAKIKSIFGEAATTKDGQELFKAFGPHNVSK